MDVICAEGAIVIVPSNILDRLPDGQYTSGVWLCSTKEVQDYIEIQKDYQHRVMICDRDDFCVFEMIDGKLVHPSPEAVIVKIVVAFDRNYFVTPMC